MRLKVWSAIVVATISIAAAAQETETIDAIVATVDKEVILYSDLLTQVGGAIETLRQTANSREEFLRESNKLVDDALNNSINRHLAAREARKYPELAVSDKDLEDQINAIRQEEGSSFDEIIKQYGSMSEYREWLRTQIVALRMRYRMAATFENEISVSEQEISEFYDANRDRYEKPERVYVRQIFLRASGDEAERANVRARLEDIRQQILDGASFESMARAHSEAQSAQVDGAIGWSRREDFVEPLSSAAFELPVGGVSEVLETQFGFNLLKVDQREEAGVVPLSEVRLAIEQELRKQGADKKYDTWLADLRKRSRVRVFAIQ